MNIGTVTLSNQNSVYSFLVDIDNFLNDNLDECLAQTDFDDYQLYIEVEEALDDPVIFDCNITEEAFLSLFSKIQQYEIHEED